MSKKTPTDRTALLRRLNAERVAAMDRCDTHGHAINPAAKFGSEYRYVCGCRTGKFRK